MGYIGAQLATNFETVRKQVSTTNSGTTITLDYSVSSVQDILVTVNAVVQSYDNYSVSGTTLTLGGTLNNDRVEILYVGRTFQTVTPAVGTVTNEMLSGSIANSKLANSSITLNGSAVSLGGSATVGGDNTPAFLVYKTSNQELSDNAFTKVTFDTEDFDTDSAFASNKFTVPSGKAGKYRFDTQLYFIANSNTLDLFYGTFYINGSTPNIVNRTGNSVNMWNNEGGEQCLRVTSTFNLSEGDYVEVYGKLNVNSGTPRLYAYGNWFSGFKLIS